MVVRSFACLLLVACSVACAPSVRSRPQVAQELSPTAATTPVPSDTERRLAFLTSVAFDGSLFRLCVEFEALDEPRVVTALARVGVDAERLRFPLRHGPWHGDCGHATGLLAADAARRLATELDLELVLKPESKRALAASVSFVGDRQRAGSRVVANWEVLNVGEEPFELTWFERADAPPQPIHVTFVPNVGHRASACSGTRGSCMVEVVTHEFAPGARRSLDVPLSAGYDLSQPGRYDVTLTMDFLAPDDAHALNAGCSLAAGELVVRASATLELE